MAVVIRRRRVLVMALAFALGACGTQAVGIPSRAPSGAPSAPSATATPTPTARPTNATSDVLYVRQTGPRSTVAANGQLRIDVIDGRTGRVLRETPNGVVSADRRLLYTAESVDGDTRTVVHVLDLATGAEKRSVTVPGYYQTLSDGFEAPLTPDGRWLVLWRQAFKLNDQVVSRFAVVDTTGRTATPVELKDTMTYGLAAVSPDGRELALWQYGTGEMRLRVLDVATKTFSDLHGWDGRQENGFRSPFVNAGDRLYSVVASEHPYVLAIDPATSVVVKVALPAGQASSDFEKFMLWSLAVTPDGRTAYAVNPVLGVVDELDLTHLAVRRSSRLTSAARDTGVVVRLLQMLFPVADAKEYLRTGALLSPDGHTLYAAGTNGVSVIDTGSLTLRGRWAPGATIGSLALTPDGARLYAVDDRQGAIRILDARDGAVLGSIDAHAFATVMRIDPQ